MVVMLLGPGIMLPSAGGQEKYLRGQNIAPIFDGWEQNPDSSFNMVFGYLNRNYEEIIDIPIGSDNNIEPGGPDQGQPTRFFPRRSRFLFRVRVPKDFGNKELVWTLTAHDSSAWVPADGKSSVKVTFSQAGTYVLRVTADDGGLFSVRDVAVTVE